MVQNGETPLIAYEPRSVNGYFDGLGLYAIEYLLEKYVRGIDCNI